jgi:predicted secreted protein
MALAFYSQNNKIKPLALHEYMEKKKNQARTKAKRTGGSQSQSGSQTQRVGGSQTVAVVIN